MITFKKLIIFSVACNSALLHSMDLALEAKEEFTSRTQKLPCSKMYTNIDSYYFIEPRGASMAYYAACPDNISRVLLRPAEEERKAQLVVLNKASEMYARQFLSYKKFIAVALAAQRDLFATIHETPEHEILKIRRVDTKKTLKTIKIPTYFQVACAMSANPVIAFNKQGTDIIVWGTDARKEDLSCEEALYKRKVSRVPALDYMIFNFEEELKAQKVRK